MRKAVLPASPSPFSALPLLLSALLLASPAALAFPADMCAADRYGSDLSCTANDVQVTDMTVVSGPAVCTGGGSVTLDINITVNFGSASRYDIGVFIPNDGKDPQLLSANGGAATCNVASLPTSSPFQDLDSAGGLDTCGDGSGGLSGTITLYDVTVPCQALGSTGKLYIPFVVSWDHRASPSGALCATSADVVPSGTSKCNSPTIAQGSVDVVVLPDISKSDGIDVITPGTPTTYTVTITNNLGIPLGTATGNAAVFRDPAVNNLTVTGVSCTASGGATCPTSTTIAGMQDAAGLTIPYLPNGSSVTFTVAATVDPATPAGTVISNVATVTANGHANTATDSNTVVYPSLLHLKSVAIVSDPVNGSVNPKYIPGAEIDYTLRVSNTGLGTVSADSVLITDPIPANTELFVGDLGGGSPIAFTQGTPSSNLTWTYVSLANLTDDLDFSNDGGASWNYVPSGLFDPNVTAIRFNPKGTMGASSGAGSPYFDLRFRVRLK